MRGRRRRWSRSSTARSAGPTRRSSRSTRSPPSSPSARSRWSRRSRSTAATLHAFDGFRFAVYPRRGGRAPELEDPDDARVDRPLHRPHPRRRRAARRSPQRPGARHRDASATSRATACSRTASFPPTCAPRGRAWSTRRSTACAHCFERAGDVATLRLHGDCHAGNVLWTDGRPALRRLRRRRTGPAVQDLWMLLSGDRADDDAAARRRARRLRGLRRVRPARAASGRGAAHAAPASTTRRGSRGAGTTRPSRPPSRGSTRSATGRTASSSCASRSR